MKKMKKKKKKNKKKSRNANKMQTGSNEDLETVKKHSILCWKYCLL